MKVAVLGCGAIGGLFLGYLSQVGYDVVGIVRDYQKDKLLKEGLLIEGVRGSHRIKVSVDDKLRQEVDLVIFATKIGDLYEAIEENLKYMKNAYIITTQNGIKADYIIKEYFPVDKIVTGIVMFGATFYSPNKIMHNFEGDLILGNIFGEKVSNLESLAETIRLVFDTNILDNIKGAKYLKLFINLNNCIPAVLGLSIQEVFADIDLAKLAILINREAYKVISQAKIDLASLPTYPKDRIEGLVSMGLDEAGAIFSKIMTSLSKEPLYGSILQSIQRLRKSEIDYINGEIVSLAKEVGLKVPLNTKIVKIIHRVEETGKFLNKEELVLALGN